MSTPAFRSRRLRSATLALGALALAASACSSDEGETQGSNAGSGPDEQFYVAPDPLPEGEPGDLIRVMDVGEAEGRVTLKIMYHSSDAQGPDRQLSALCHPGAGGRATTLPSDDASPS